MRIVMVGPFGMRVKSTMRDRALPMAQALVRRGHEASIIVPPWDSPADAGHTYVSDGVRIINTQLPRRKGPIFHIRLTRLLVQATLNQKPDIIHLFKPKAYAGLAHSLLLTLRRLKRHQARLIVDEDDWEVAWNEVNDYSRAQKAFFRWQEPWGLRQADCVTVASKTLERLVEGLKIPSDKVYYVPNGFCPLETPLDLLRPLATWQTQLCELVGQANSSPAQASPLIYTPTPLDWRDYSGRVRAEHDLFGKPIVLLYTRFFEFQLTFLIKLIDRINQLLPEVRWLVVGQGYFDEETQLKQMIQQRGLVGKLIFAGWVPLKQLPHYFAAANAAIYPYDDTILNQTKCSVKLLHLLSSGVPVVASRVGQNMEYIKHGHTGLLVPPHNVEAMTEALLLILHHRELQGMLGYEATRYVHRVFHWDRLVDSVEAAYSYA